MGHCDTDFTQKAQVLSLQPPNSALQCLHLNPPTGKRAIGRHKDTNGSRQTMTPFAYQFRDPNRNVGNLGWKNWPPLVLRKEWNGKAQLLALQLLYQAFSQLWIKTLQVILIDKNSIKLNHQLLGFCYCVSTPLVF